MKLQLAGPYRGISPNISTREFINILPRFDDQVLSFVGRPGLKPYVTPGGISEVRGMFPVGTDFIISVVGNRVYKTLPNLTSTIIGDIGSHNGPVSMSANTGEIVLVAGSQGYVINLATSTMVEWTGVDGFPSDPGTATFLDSYSIVNHTANGEWQYSGQNNASTWEALDYLTAELGGPDKLVAVGASRRELWLWGERTTEIWYDSGSDPPFAIMSGGLIECGLSARFSPVLLENAYIWLDHNYVVRRAESRSPAAISTREMGFQFSTYSTLSDAIGFSIQSGGHSLYLLTFPSVTTATWVYDLTSGLWSEWSSYPHSSTFSRFRGNCSCLWLGKTLIGDFANGVIYELDWDTYDDNGNYIERRVTSNPVREEGKMITYHDFQIEMQTGVGLISGTGEDPRALLTWSDDHGNNWSNGRLLTMGKIGEGWARARDTRLGSSRSRVWRLLITDPVKVAISNAYFNATLGR